MSKHFPNILWIQTDEQRPDSLGCWGSRWAKTPNLDALAASGVVFRNAVCQAPVCLPSRTSQMTCRYPHEVAAMTNDMAQREVLPPGTLMFTQLLAAVGYQTVTFGKRHLPKWDSWQRHESCVLNAEYSGYFALNARYSESEHHVVKRPSSTPIILAGRYPTFEPNPSRTITDWAINFLRERDRSRPFLLRVSHNWPHTPVLAPPPFDELYDPGQLPVRFYDAEAYAGRSDADRQIADSHRMSELSKEQYRQMWKDYMGLCAYVDYEVGRLLAVVQSLALDHDTIVVYSSDHGKNLGEWGAGEKGTFDRQCWGVPFIWSWPGHVPEGKVSDELCELLDTGRTLAGLTGVDAPAHWRGRDLFSSSPPAAVFGEIGVPNSRAALLNAGEKKEDEANKDHRPLQVGVRTARHRLDLVWMKDGRRVDPADGNFFDLETDPLEKRNLWHETAAASTRQELLRRLEEWFAGLDKPAALFGN